MEENQEVKEPETVNPESVKQEPKLTREQRRAIDRINKEANEQHKRLVNQFYEFFMDADVASDAYDIQEKKREVSAKWKMYCKNRSLSAEVLPMVEKTCDEILKQFDEIKNERPST